MGTPRRLRCSGSGTFAVGLVLLFGAGNGVLADAPATAASAGSVSGDAPKSLPQENFLSSVTESLRLDPGHEVVRAHFDLGSAPNSHRYYCLIDTKTGRREPNGVLGHPLRLPDGTTGIKVDSVSLYGCDDAAKQGMLITAGYLLQTPAGAAVAQSPQAPSPAAMSPDKIDVAGVQLGMSLDEARAVLKSKKLRETHEATETLGYWDAAKGAMQSIADGRFVNILAAWTAPAAGEPLEADGESYEVMFTPVPGKQRVMAIIHSVGYSRADAVSETALEVGLVRKYGGFAGSNDLPDSPTWRWQSGGGVRTGDPCNRRGLFGGLGGLNLANSVRENIALKKPPDELRFEIGRCGVAIVTEDQYTANGGALPADRLVTRFTVTAYSPSLALEGAESAAQLIQAAKGVGNKADASRAKARKVPNL